ncbi:mucin-associated surface protein (MASP) [Trypanosoma cruzi Dm28c]|uniref:Mucin-associated surface protein (MASP) n=1 Tax=Trypanosoma cruzi Dm28c TaxID=1416333 RepID=V5B7C5_TRYCR|nr:mucin-associated surface protein (MASP) [Trypanosoma cruzi Dm28c]PBJ77329.1 mucin-associated surface protein [Trypanosoma cruzi cruzi]
MAMMMAGRVLLVCALCVLWCGAAFGHAMEGYCGEGGGDGLRHTSNGGGDVVSLKTNCGQLSTRMALIKAVEAADDGEDGSIDASLEKTEKSLHISVLAGPVGNAASGAGKPPPPSGRGESGTGAETGQLDVSGQHEENNRESNNKTAAGPQEQNNGQLLSLSGSTPTRPGENPSLMGKSDINQLAKDTVTKGDTDRQDNHESDEVIEEGEEGDGEKYTENPQEKDNAQTQTREGQNNGGASPLLLPTPSAVEGSPPAEKENSQNSAKVKDEITPSGPKVDSEAPEPPPRDATQGQHSHDTETEDLTKNAATDSPAETKTSFTSTSGSGDHLQNKADEDDAQSSEGNNDSIDTGNTKVVLTLSETAPQTAETATAARINDTALPGNSDGSTAIPHTTSPLLLLLVVACAAAAAVVAA